MTLDPRRRAALAEDDPPYHPRYARARTFASDSGLLISKQLVLTVLDNPLTAVSVSKFAQLAVLTNPTDSVSVSKIVQHVVLKPPDGLSLSQFFQLVVIETNPAPAASPGAAHGKSLHIPDENEYTPLFQRRFVPFSAYVFQAPPVVPVPPAMRRWLARQEADDLAPGVRRAFSPVVANTLALVPTSPHPAWFFLRHQAPDDDAPNLAMRFRNFTIDPWLRVAKTLQYPVMVPPDADASLAKTLQYPVMVPPDADASLAKVVQYGVLIPPDHNAGVAKVIQYPVTVPPDAAASVAKTAQYPVMVPPDADAVVSKFLQMPVLVPPEAGGSVAKMVQYVVMVPVVGVGRSGGKLIVLS